MILVGLIVDVLLGLVVIRFALGLVTGSRGTWDCSFLASLALGIATIVLSYVLLYGADMTTEDFRLWGALAFGVLGAVLIRTLVRTEDGPRSSWGASIGTELIHRIILFALSFVLL